MAEPISQPTSLSHLRHPHLYTSYIQDYPTQSLSSHTQRSTSSEADLFCRDFHSFKNKIYQKHPNSKEELNLENGREFKSEVGSRSLEEEIKVLNKKLKKKDDLIHYLQRKCGNQVIKSTGVLYHRIYQLEQQNKKLLEISQANTPTYQAINTHEKRTPHLLHALSEAQLHSIILTQASEIEKLFKKLQLKQNNKRKRGVKLMDENYEMNLSENQPIMNTNLDDTFSSVSISDDKIHRIELINSSFQSIKGEINRLRKSSIEIPTTKKKTKSHSQDCRQKYEQGVQSQEIQRVSQQIQTQEDQKMIQIQRDNIQFQEKIKKLEQELLEVREELSFFREKIQSCYDNLDYNIEESMDLFSPAKSRTSHRDASINKEISCNIRECYMQIVDAIGIDVQEFTMTNEIHQIILQQIQALKKQTRKMMKEFNKLERQLIKLSDQKYSIEEQLMQERVHNEGMNKFIQSLTVELNSANELIMNCKIEHLDHKYKNRSDHIQQRTQPGLDLPRGNINIQQ